MAYVSMYLKWQIIATHIFTLYSQNAGRWSCIVLRTLPLGNSDKRQCIQQKND